MVVLDSEYVFKGITEWLVKWHRYGWRVKLKDVGHRDMWGAIFALRREAGSLLQFVWTPSHVKVSGNDEADVLAEEGRLQHPNNNKRRPQSHSQWCSCGRTWDSVPCDPTSRLLRGQAARAIAISG